MLHHITKFLDTLKILHQNCKKILVCFALIALLDVRIEGLQVQVVSLQAPAEAPTPAPAEANGLQAQVDALQAQVAALQAQADESKAQPNDWQARVKKLEEENQQLYGRVERLENENQKLYQDIGILEGTLELREQQLLDKKNRLESLQKENRIRIQAITNLRSQVTVAGCGSRTAGFDSAAASTCPSSRRRRPCNRPWSDVSYI